MKGTAVLFESQEVTVGIIRFAMLPASEVDADKLEG